MPAPYPYTVIAKAIYASMEEKKISDDRGIIEEIKLPVIKQCSDNAVHQPLNKKDPFFGQLIDPAKAVHFSTGHQIDWNSLGTLCAQKGEMVIYFPETKKKVVLPRQDERCVRALHFKERYSFSRQTKDFLETAEALITLGGFGVISALIVVAAVLAITSPLSLGVAIPVVAAVGAYCAFAGGIWEGVRRCFNYSEKKEWFSSQLDNVKGILAKSDSDVEKLKTPRSQQNLTVAPTLFSNVNSAKEEIEETSFMSIGLTT